MRKTEKGAHKAEKEILTISSWKRKLNLYKKRFLAGWKVYRRSKSGMVGLGIIFTFVFMALLAPFITPYSPDYIAPAEDVFKADYIDEPIPNTGNYGILEFQADDWKAPIGFSGSLESLDTITIYSSEGQAVQYKVDRKAVGKGVGIDFSYNHTYEIPENIEHMFPIRFRGSFFFAIANDSFYELHYSPISIKSERYLGFQPIYLSNLWNTWSPTNPTGPMYISLTNETKISVYSKVPPNTMIGEIFEKEYLDIVDVRDYNETMDSHIIGDPIILRVIGEVNGSLIIVPTNKAIIALELVVSTSGSRITDVSIGEIVWNVSYEDLDDPEHGEFIPATERPITISKEEPSETEGKNRIILASKDGFLYSIRRNNGTIDWKTRITNSVIRSPTIKSVYPTYRGEIIATGQAKEGLFFIASISPENGLINGNGSWFFTLLSPIQGRPQYIASNWKYIFGSEDGTIFILSETLGLDATFSVPGEAVTFPSYVGNIINNIGSVQGNYYAVVTKDATLFAQSITGTYIAPLPPGTYPSGNHYLLGTDVFGHDIFTNLVYATRTELVVGIVAAVLSAGLGTLIGLLAGYFGGWIDVILMRITDIFLTLPILVIALLMAAVLGPSIGNIILIIAIFSWAGVARVIRAQALSLKNRSFIDAARVSGASNKGIIFRHMGPNVLPLTFLYMVFTISAAIITEAILAFLGMGDQTAITWGMMLQYLRISGNTLTAPWWLLPPGIAITLFSLSFYLLGRAFDEVVNPRLRSR